MGDTVHTCKSMWCEQPLYMVTRPLAIVWGNILFWTALLRVNSLHVLLKEAVVLLGCEVAWMVWEKQLGCRGTYCAVCAVATDESSVPGQSHAAAASRRCRCRLRQVCCFLLSPPLLPGWHELVV